MSAIASPRWNLTDVFPALDSPEFVSAFDSIGSDIAQLHALFDAHDVRGGTAPTVDGVLRAAFDAITSAMNGLIDRLRVVGTYLHCHVTTDARNEAAQARRSELSAQTVRLEQLRVRYVAWIGSLDLEALLAESEIARDHEFLLRRAQQEAVHQMSEAEESLAAELAPAAIIGWVRLHGGMTALLETTVEMDGERKAMPMSSVRSLASHPDREVRRRAYEAEIAAWETIARPIAAALNGVKGWQRTLRARRRYADDVEPTLAHNSIDAPTLAAMQQACVESFPDFRRYIAAKARALGIEKPGWYDLTAPVAASVRTWTWEDATRFVIRNFGLYSDRLREFAARAFSEGWIDAEPRSGKEGGAYCAPMRAGESRVMMNYDGSFGSVSTLAHELGHAYHNLNLAHRTPMQRMTPSTLAETASIFCETLAFDAALSQAEPAERLALLDTTLERDLMVVVDIHSRFLFEKAVFQGRAERDLTVTELNELMLQAQREAYGNEVDPLHPFMWVVKGHYYGPTFYNYPYTFGLLFGLGIYAAYKRDPDRIRAQYDDFLSSTGMADAADLGRRFGADVQNVDFWRAGLDEIRAHIDEFIKLTS